MPNVNVKYHINDLTEDILAGIVDGVVVTDDAGKILIWNRAAEELSGIASDDAVGRDVRNVLADNPAVVSQTERTRAPGRL